MGVSCEYLRWEHGDGIGVWIHPDQPFSEDAFFEALRQFSGIEVLERRNVVAWFAPCVFVEEVTTNRGTFLLSDQLEDLDAGWDIYRSSDELMATILLALESSDRFHERGQEPHGFADEPEEGRKRKWWRIW